MILPEGIRVLFLRPNGSRPGHRPRLLPSGLSGPRGRPSSSPPGPACCAHSRETESVNAKARCLIPIRTLIFFFVRLLARLQARGTVAALDFREYGQALMTVAEAFEHFKSELELPDREQAKAADTQKAIRERVSRHLFVADSFLPELVF